MDIAELVVQARKFSKTYRVTDGKKFRLKDVDPATPAGSRPRTSASQGTLAGGGFAAWPSFRTCFYAQDHWAVLLVFQAMDAAGKDGAIKHVMSGVNPQGCQVHSFKAPSAEELDHDFLWRCTGACPSAAASASSTARTTRKCWSSACIRNFWRSRSCRRSWSTKDIWKERYEDIRSFERYLSRNGVVDPQVLPPRLEEGAEEALPRAARQARRRTGSSRPTDVREREFWDDYMDGLRGRDPATRRTETRRGSSCRPTTSGSRGSSWPRP